MEEQKRKVNYTARIVIACIFLIIAAVCAWRLNDYVSRKRYKLTYQTLIANNAEEYDLNPYLVAAVIHVESANNSEAVSPRGAVGLMQIMPDTGAWIAEKLNEPFSEAMLRDPATNIRYGCWYLRFLFDRFDVTNTAIAAYNAGHNKVAGWLDDTQYSGDGDALDEIPYEETKNYVDKVQRAYDAYRKYYPNAFPGA